MKSSRELADTFVITASQFRTFCSLHTELTAKLNFPKGMEFENVISFPFSTSYSDFLP
jgi:hypothetical protein